jgi:hypothetical protein
MKGVSLASERQVDSPPIGAIALAGKQQVLDFGRFRQGKFRAQEAGGVVN